MEPGITVYYHADCLDGFAAAYAAWRRFGAAARYLPLHYDHPWNHDDVAGRRVFVLDVCFPRPVFEVMARVAESVWLIDHHASARDAWEDCLQRGDDGVERHVAGGLHLYFDMQCSGARLAWQHFHPDLPVPLALAMVEDQDLWRFSLQGTRALCRALRLRPFDFAAWHEVVEAVKAGGETRARVLAEGEAVDRFMRLEVARLARGNQVAQAGLPGEPLDALQAQRHGQALMHYQGQTWTRLEGLAANANAMFASDLGNQLAEMSGSYGLVWYQDGSGLIKVSLRACGRVNVARIAEHFGGGGHPNAAGFRMPAQVFLPLVLGVDA